MGDCNTWTCAQVDRLLKPYTAVYLRSGVRRCVARGRVCTFPCRTCYYFMESELSGTYGVASWVALFLIFSLHSPHLSLPTPSAKKAPRHRRRDIVEYENRGGRRFGVYSYKSINSTTHQPK